MSLITTINQKMIAHLGIGTLHGNEVTCLICNHSFLTFIPYNKRANARCPNCKSLERHRLLFLYFNQKLNLFGQPTKTKFLHIAPEQVFIRLFKQNRSFEYTYGDLNPERYPQGAIKLNLLQLDFPDNSFDFVMCNHVLEHIEDDHKAMTEVYRVLKPNGKAILQVPIDYSRTETYEDFTITTDAGRLAAFGLEDHVRIYGTDYLSRLQTAGFNVDSDSFLEIFTTDKRFEYGLGEKEVIYLCSK